MDVYLRNREAQYQFMGLVRWLVLREKGIGYSDIHALNDSHLTLGTRDPFTGIGSVYSGVYLGGRWDFQANLLHATALLRIQHDKVPGPPTAAQLKRN